VAGGVLLSTECSLEQLRAVAERDVMKAIVFLKLLVVSAIFLLLVLIGLNNRATVDFSLPPVLAEVIRQPAALMYFGFFAVGLLTGAVLCIPGGKSAGKSGKPA
jgi:uncharacterized integral membrane protein